MKKINKQKMKKIVLITALLFNISACSLTSTSPLKLTITQTEKYNDSLQIQLLWTTTKGNIFYDSHSIDHYYKINNGLWRHFGTIAWRHPYKETCIKQITSGNTHSYTLYIDLKGENTKTIDSIQIKAINKKPENIEELEKLDNWTKKGFDNFKRSWFGVLVSNKYEMK